MLRFGTEAAPARLMAKRRNIAARRKSGAEFPAEASIAKVDTPAGRYYTVVLRDVSERVRDQRNEHVLAEAGARLAGLPLDLEATLRTVANLPVPLLADWTLVNVVDGETVHRAASNHRDPRRDAVLRDLERLKPDYDALAPLAETVATGRARLVERIDGAWIAEHLSDPQRRRAARLLGARSGLVVPLVARGRVLGTLMLVRATPTPPYDAADLALAEAIAQRAALAIDNARLFDDAQCAAQLRDEVLGVVSHDLRTPVTAIDMCARALLDQQPDAPPEVTELYCAIRRSARWAQHIIGDLLDVASIEAGRLSLNPRLTSPARVTDELREVFAPLAAERGVTFAANVAPDLPRVWADPERLVQALGNLLGNGIKFTPAGGSVALDVAGSEGVVCFTVTDTGPGISAAELPHVFDRFWRGRGARTGGAGLGLTIVKALADLHGALLTVESALGQGTTCAFTIPIATVDAGLLAQHDQDLVTSAGEVPQRD
jgi:signal transduction histidine kinase